MNGNTMRVTAASAALVVLLTAAAGAGTLTAERVYAGEVLTREIGTPPPPPGTLYYPFVENEGSAVTDASGNGYDGTASGCVWTNAGAYEGGSLFFDGVDDYVNAGSVSNFPAWDQYSVSLWFLHNGGGYLGDYQYGQKMLDKTSWYHDWRLHLWPGGGSIGSIGLCTYEGGASTGFGDNSQNYMDNAWHHVALVRDGANAWFWVDGDLKSTCTNMFSVYSDSDVCVGYSFSGDSYQQTCWSGMLDEVRIFDRALSSNEVVNLYVEGTLPKTGAVSVTTNLTVCGGLTVTGRVSFAEGVRHSRPLGDLSCGIYTNAP